MTARNATITLAAVQAHSRPGQVEANLEHAAPLIADAAERGAQLVVLPELFSCGYIPSRAVWDVAEGPDGPTARWLAATARRHGIYLGAGAAESDGTDFYNTFILAGPDGRIAGRAYKANAEASVFRRGRDQHMIDTPLGRIGVRICADNQFAAQLRLMHDQQADLVLMPHAWPTPARAGGLVSQTDGRPAGPADRAPRSVRALPRSPGGVRQSGRPALPIGGILGRLMNPRIWRLRGQSRIIDSDGTLLGELGDDEGAVAGAATLDPGRKHNQQPPEFGGWLQPGPWLERKVIIPIDIATGRLRYAASRKRPRKAQTSASRKPASHFPPSVPANGGQATAGQSSGTAYR